MSWNVLIAAPAFATLGAEALALLRQAGANLVIPPQFSPWPAAEVEAKLPGIDAVIAGLEPFSAAVLKSANAKSLKIVSRWGVGYDSVDIATATNEGIVVANTPGLLNSAVADWTFALLLCVARRVHTGHNTVTAGQWVQHWGHDVAGKTLGLVGFGQIGRAVARRASGFDMRVLVHAPSTVKAEGVTQTSLEELLRESDFVSLHAALTPANRGLIGEPQLKLMKQSAYLINTARGPLVVESALARALVEGWIAGAAMDVFEQEPLPKESPLRHAPNLLLEPHQASFARETGERVSLAAATAVVELIQGRRPKWVVNEAVLSSSSLRTQISNPPVPDSSGGRS